MKYFVLLIAISFFASSAVAQVGQPIPVTVDNFIRAETDNYFTKFVKDGGFGKFHHERALAPIDKQTVIRMNRDTLYSFGVFDLDASPVTITLPDAGKRFMAMMVVNQDHYVPEVVYAPGPHAVTKEKVGTRYVGQTSLKKIREALLALTAANGGIDSSRMFGRKDQVDPVQHLLGTAAGWGGNPKADAMYAGAAPKENDGKKAYTLTLKDVPVDGFWSVSVYNKDGFFETNAKDAYTLNNVTAKTNADGSTVIRFGGNESAPNYLPITPGWNYVIRLYRPRKELLDGTWKVPEAQPVP